MNSMTVLLEICPQRKEDGEPMEIYSGQKGLVEGYSNTARQVSNNMKHFSNK